MRTTSGKILTASAAGLVVVVVVLPLVGLVIQGLGRSGPGDAVVLPGPSPGDFGRTIVVGLAAAGSALLLGVPAALVYARGRLPGRRLLALLAVVPLAISPSIHAYAWLIYPGGDSLPAGLVRAVLGATPGGVAAAGAPAWACGVVLGLGLWPVVAFLSGAALLGGGGALEEAASTSAGEGRVLWRVTLARLGPGARRGALVVYWLAAASFTVPSLMGVQTLSTEVFALVSASGSTRPALLGSLGILASAALPLLLVIGWARRGGLPVAGDAAAGRPLRRARWPLLAVAAIGVALGAVVPVASLVGQLGGGAALGRAWQLGAEPLLHSAIVAAAAATLAVGLGFLVAGLVRLADIERSHAVLVGSFCAGVAGFACFVLPPYLIGEGLTSIYNHPGPLRWIYEGWPVLALGLGAAYYLPAAMLLGASVRGVPATTIEAAAASGASPAARLGRILAPLVRRDLMAAWLLLFALFLGEAGSAVLREPPGFQTAQVLVFNQMHYGRDSDVAALALIVAGAALLPLALALLVSGRGRGA